MKVLSFFVALFCLSTSLYAQTGLNQVWENELTNTAGTATLEIYAVKSGAGGTAVAGFTSTESGITMYVASYQTNGQLLWETTLPTPNLSGLRYLETDSQGNLYVAGTEITGSFNERQTHLAKLNSNGQILWQRTYRGPDDLFASPYDLVVTASHVYMAGTEKGTPSYELAWVAQFDLDGNLLWDNAFDPGNGASLSELVVDDAGTVTAVGFADYGYSFLVLQYASDGTFKWQYPASLTGSSEQYLSDVVADNNGNLYAIGSEEVGAFFEFDIVTLKLDSTGTLLWKRNYNNGGENNGAAVRIGPDKTIYAFGNKEDNFDDFALTIAYDSTGTQLWETDYDIDGGTSIVDVEIGSNGNLYLGVQDFDSLGFVALSAGGSLLAANTYSQDQADYLTDISLSANGLAGAAYIDGGGSVLFFLQTPTLTENVRVQAEGVALSDARPGAMTTDGNHLWLSTFADDGDTALFSITKMDLSGNVLWEKGLSYATAIPAFPYLSHDGAGNVVGLFQNGLTVSAGHIGLVKYNAAGVEQFTVLLDSANVYTAGGLALDNAGNIFLTGYNEGTKRMLVSRYDAAGALQWTRYYQSPSTSFPFARPYQMQYTAQGKLVIAATHKGADSSNDLHLFQYANDGTLEWHADVANQPGNLTDFSGMEISATGEISIFGSSGIGNYVAARFSNTGTLLWDEKGSNPSGTAPRSMAVDAQGRMYLCFSANGYLYIRLLDASGTLITTKQLSLPSTGSFYFPWKCSVVNDQLVILGEHLRLSGGVPFEMLIDNQLELVYGSIDSLKRAKIQAMAVDPTGDLYGTYLTGDLALSDGYRGALVRKFSIGTVGIEDQPFGGLQALRLYPNPVREQLTVELEAPVAGLYRFFLYDLQGRKIAKLAEEHLLSGPASVSLRLPAELGSGIYLLGLASDQGTAFRKVRVY